MLLTLVLITTSAKAIAARVVPAPSPVNQEPHAGVAQAEDRLEDPDLLEDTRQLISGRVVDLANRLDSFFGEQRADDELNRSALRLSYARILRMERRSRERVEVRLNLRLPNLEDKFRFSVEKNEPKKDDTPQDPVAARLEAERKEREREAKRKEEEEKEPWRFRGDTGVVVSVPPSAFARARLRKNWRLIKYVPRFIEEVGYYTDRGLVESTTFNVDRRLRDDLLFRFENDKIWQITDKEFNTEHGPTLQHKFTEDDAFSYSAKGSTTVDWGSWYLNNWRVAVSYRRNLRNQWLYGEITPAIDFPKTESFRRMPSITVRVESLFGTR